MKIPSFLLSLYLHIHYFFHTLAVIKSRVGIVRLNSPLSLALELLSVLPPKNVGREVKGSYIHEDFLMLCYLSLK